MKSKNACRPDLILIINTCFLVGKAEKPDTLDIVDELRQALVGQEYMIEYVRTCHDGYK